MRKKITHILAYTVFVAAISALITTAWFHYFILNQHVEPPEKTLASLTAEQAASSAVKDGDDIVEIFSYGCHFCALHEKDIQELEKRLPAGKKLVHLHMSLDGQGGLARYAPVFATLQVMGIETEHRESAYKAVMKENIDLIDKTQRDLWLKENNIDIAQYEKISQSQDVKSLLNYMTRVTQQYNITATPTFIINKKWVAIQDRPFPDFSDQLLSLLENDKPLEK